MKCLKNSILHLFAVYYQWAPFVLGLQCCLFYVPRLIWQAICTSRMGIDLENLISQAMTAEHSNDADRKVAVENVAADIEVMLFQVRLSYSVIS